MQEHNFQSQYLDASAFAEYEQLTLETDTDYIELDSEDDDGLTALEEANLREQQALVDRMELNSSQLEIKLQKALIAHLKRKLAAERKKNHKLRKSYLKLISFVDKKLKRIQNKTSKGVR